MVDIKNLKNIPRNAINIRWSRFPYRELFRDDSSSLKDIVIFWGNAMNDLAKYINRDEYIKKTNACLDFIRKNCQGLKLYYKPHPADSSEAGFLKLNSFQVIKDATTSELFLLEHAPRIKYSFAVNSWSAPTAYCFGINSYLFYKVFNGAYGPALMASFDIFFHDLPDNMFVKNLDSPLIENGCHPQRNTILGEGIKSVLNEKSGDVWLVVTMTDFLGIIVALSMMIKKHDPARKINLIIGSHHRWAIIDFSVLGAHFDKIINLPRIFYSLRPAKILNMLKLAKKIRAISIKDEDIIIGTSHGEFVENCLISYHRKAKRVFVMMSRDLHLYYETDTLPFFGEKKFLFSKGSLLFNRVLEPLLGLNKTMFLSYEVPDIFNIYRYEKPVNEIYDEVYVLNVSNSQS